MRLFLCALAQEVYAVVGERMVVEPAVTPGFLEHLLVAELGEEVDEPLGRLAALLQVGDGRLVGARLLLAGVAGGPKGAEIGRGTHQRRRRVARAGDRGQYAQAHRQQVGDHAGLLHLAPAHGVVAGGVAGLVGDDPDQLVGIVGLLDQVGAEEQELVGRRGGVEDVGLQDDGDVPGVEACGGEHPVKFLVQDLVDLGVQDHLGLVAPAAALLRLGDRRQQHPCGGRNAQGGVREALGPPQSAAIQPSGPHQLCRPNATSDVSFADARR